MSDIDRLLCHGKSTCHRYDSIFERVEQSEIPDDVMDYRPYTELFIVQAPANSVELLEAMLKPPAPFEVVKTKLIPRRIRTDGGRRIQRLCQEFRDGQGRLCDHEIREVSVVCLPLNSFYKLRDITSWFWPHRLHYMSLACKESSGKKFCCHPYAMINSCHGESPSRAWYMYKKDLKGFLRTYSPEGHSFERSLLDPGTVPVPESWEDLVRGKPGHRAALPYFKQQSQTESSPVGDTFGMDCLKQEEETENAAV